MYNPGEVDAIITIGATATPKIPVILHAMKQATWDDNDIRIFSILYVSTNKFNVIVQDATEFNGTHKCDTWQILLRNLKTQVMTALRIFKQNLSEIAGVNTSMDLDFQECGQCVNNTTYSGMTRVSLCFHRSIRQSYNQIT